MSTRPVARQLAGGVIPSVAQIPSHEQEMGGLSGHYLLRKRVNWTLLGLLLGIVIAGMWDYKTVDGFGRGVVAANTIGDTSKLAGSFTANGLGFGVIFAAIAGLAATFTACNCVVYAMLPGLACSTDKSAGPRNALRALGIFTAGVVGVGVVYGLYIGALGPANIKAFNSHALVQAQVTFVSLGAVMVVWGLIEFGFLRPVTSLLPISVRTFFQTPLARAGVMGVLVGFFAIGRPYPIFHDFLTYAATSQSPIYGAVVMSVQGLGQIAVMVVLFLAMISLFGNQLTRWVTEKPLAPSFVSAVALIAGGAYFVYYWGLAFWLGIGSWGFKLGLYQ